MMMKPVIEDKYGRRFRTLRVSLVNHCNLGCVYCVPDELSSSGGVKKRAMSAANLLEMIARLHGRLGLRTVRLTGGEPLLYSGLAELVAGIRGMGIEEVKLTTNGFLLERQAEALFAAGLESVNVSLDAIDEEVFFRMSRRHSVDRILKGIEAAHAVGLDVKVNTVVMKGINDSQILPLMEWAFGRGLRIRLLELMAMGHLKSGAQELLFSQAEMLSVIGQRWRYESLGRACSATSNYWLTEDGHCFGIIANESAPFCGDCDRLRLDSEGNIYGCLSSNEPIALGLSEDEMVWDVKLRQALEHKQVLRFVGSELGMMEIGG